MARGCVPFIVLSATEKLKQSAYTIRRLALHNKKVHDVMPVIDLGVGRQILTANFTSDRDLQYLMLAQTDALQLTSSQGASCESFLRDSKL